MRNLVAKLVIGVTTTSILMFGADNSIGTWKRNMEKSKTMPPSSNPNPLTSLTIKLEAVDGGVKQTTNGQRKDGSAVSDSFTAKYDGKEYPVTGAASWDTVSMGQIDANTFTLELKKTGGKYHTTTHSVISKDGKIMTDTIKGTNAQGTPFSATYIYDKQ
jgi:hypothetical protein